MLRSGLDAILPLLIELFIECSGDFLDFLLLGDHLLLHSVLSKLDDGLGCVVHVLEIHFVT